MNKKKASKIIDVFQNIEVAIAIILIIIFVVPLIIGFKPYVIKSGSMVPTFKIGDVAYTKKVAFSSLKDGDIIGFRLDDNTTVTHRVKEKHDAYIITKGDANKTEDAKYVYEDYLIGKVYFHVPYVGHFTSALNKTSAKVIVVVIVLVNVGLAILASWLNKMEVSNSQEDSSELNENKDCDNIISNKQ
ncbi:signal peptidase I [Ruminococcus bicirculans (ex Wegman et al. 2014)]|uniref:signal peptidase I n=1 Tax=Ruminococcus bicirculans (ex Wegman et al. 2014) TaxID=1160721 RepID=UPI00402A05A9